MTRWPSALLLGLSLLGAGCRQPMRKVFAERLPSQPAILASARPAPHTGPCGPALQGRHPRWDLNRIPESVLAGLPGMPPALARQIVAGRPYREKRALLTRHLLTAAQYLRWKDYLVVHHPH